MNFNEMTGPQLVDTYNHAAAVLGEKPVKRFSDRETALRRVTEILERLDERELKGEPEPLKLEPAKSRRYKGFNFPRKETIKNMRAGTLREAVRDALADGGATFEEVEAVVAKHDVDNGKNPYDVRLRAYEAVRLLHFYVGYGLEERDGKIHLVS